MEDPALERALELLRAGKSAEAEAHMEAARVEAAADHGEESHEHAIAWNGLAAIYALIDDGPRAIEALERAVAIEVDGDEPTRDRLTFQTNLAEQLHRMGRFDDAENVLHENLAAREKHYGRDHPGWGFGAEPLAATLLAKGNLEAALEVAQASVGCFWNSGHPRVGAALALYADIASGFGAPPLPDGASLDDLPDDLASELPGAVAGRAQSASNPGRGCDLIEVMIPLIAARLDGDDDPRVVELRVALSNLQRDADRHVDRVESLEALMETFARRDDPEQLLHARLGLAMAQAEAERADDARATYGAALAAADDDGGALIRSQVLRNWGLFESEVGRIIEAEKLLRDSIAAVTVDEPEALGRAEVALGVVLQHDGRPGDEAAELFKTAIERLDVGHPDAICARGHLRAIEEGGPCACGDQEAALTEAFTALVRPNVPDGLIGDLRIELSDEGELKVGVELVREPTEEEHETIDRVVRHALHQLRQGIRRHYG